MHYYRFSIGDYARSTRHLSNDEDLAYRRLLDMYYENERPIPLETQWVARRIRMDTEVVQIVLNDMFKRSDDGFRHTRCDAEIAEYHKQAERNRANGKQGGRPKSVKKQQIKNPVGFQSEPDSIPVVTLTTNHKPITNNQEPNITPLNPPKGKAVSIPLGVEIEVWNDFLELRKTKRAPLTRTALDGIEREAAKAGWTLNDALSESVARGWQGFKAEWVKERTKGNGSRETESMGRTERAAIQALRDLGFAQAAPGGSQSGSDALPTAGRNVIVGNQSSPLLTIGYDGSGSGGMVEGGTDDDR